MRKREPLAERQPVSELEKMKGSKESSKSALCCRNSNLLGFAFRGILTKGRT